MKSRLFLVASATLHVVLFTTSGCGGGGGGGGDASPTSTPPAATLTRTATTQPTPTSSSATATPPPTATLPPPATNTPASTPTGNELDISICAPNAGPFSAVIDHPFFPMPVGTGAKDIFEAAAAEEWAAAATTLADMTTAWDAYRATGVSPMLEEQLSDALRQLGDEIDNEDAVEARNAALPVARAVLDFQLRHRPPVEIDRERFKLWAQQILVDAEDDDLEGVSGDATTLTWILDRFAHTLSSANVSAIEAFITDVHDAVEAEDLAGATAAAQGLLGLLASIGL